MIPTTQEFYISVINHSEWGEAHTVWGEVTDFAAVDAMLELPYKELTHPEYGTVMRMMAEPVAFDLKVVGVEHGKEGGGRADEGAGGAGPGVSGTIGGSEGIGGDAGMAREEVLLQKGLRGGKRTR